MKHPTLPDSIQALPPETEPETIAMRSLTPVTAPIASLPGIGPRYAGLLRKVANGPRIIDLLFVLPSAHIDRSAVLSLREARARLDPGAILTTRVRVSAILHPTRPRQPFRIRASDDTDDVELLFFHQAFLRGIAVGDVLAVSGKFERYGSTLTMPHPDYLVPWARRGTIPKIDPVWPLTAGLFPSVMRRAMHKALDRLSSPPEWIAPSLLRRRSWPSFVDALECLHRPASREGEGEGEKKEETNGETWSRRIYKARERLAFDECLADQLSLARGRRHARSRPGRSLSGDGTLREEALARFGHRLTGAQKRAIAEIDADLAAPTPMMRLLQGDVGAGKTLVALLAMLRAVESGAQAAMMAPTEILASQHFATVARLAPVPCVYLSGSVKGKARKQALAAIAGGEAKLVIGTHALFQEKVAFHDLALAVIDEQHRFGVRQRAMLGAKGERTDILVMTATPIPRTLLLTQWGDLSVSQLDEKPPGRKPVRTSLHPLSGLDTVLDGIRRVIRSGAQVFWVCPLIEESETLDIAAAEARRAALAERFPCAIGLAHGRQDIAERERQIDGFRSGATQLLVATTVIEVGVDIPNASVMVIEHAERFGLAQLHQLRGRVGRGAAASYCLLLYDDTIGMAGKERLTLLRETEDGFVIADRDFRLRGGGDLTGNRQSGHPGLRLGEGIDLMPLVDEAHREAERTGSEKSASEADSAPDSRIKRIADESLLILFDRSDMTRLTHAG